MTRTITNFKPHGEKILVIPDEESGGEQTTESGLVIPESYESLKNVPVTGLVVEVGDDVKGIKKGDILVYQKLFELSVDINGVLHIIIEAKNVVGSSTPTL